MKTLGEIFQLSVQYLEDKKMARPRFTVQELLAHVLQIDRMQLYMQFDQPLEQKELDSVRALLARKGRREPLEYILGTVRFYDCEFEINPSVLIPRPETEILLDLVCQEIAAEPLHGSEVWDLCTGSGCLGIGLKKKRPDLKIALTDISPEALDTARRNAQRNQVDVAFYQGDLLEPLQGRKADLVLCNPPYISKSEYETLDPSVKDYEPKRALVGGERGTDFYERLAKELPVYLHPGARVYFEIGYQQGESLKQIFSSSLWKRKILKKDWAGHDRFFFLEIE